MTLKSQTVCAVFRYMKPTSGKLKVMVFPVASTQQEMLLAAGALTTQLLVKEKLQQLTTRGVRIVLLNHLARTSTGSRSQMSAERSLRDLKGSRHVG